MSSRFQLVHRSIIELDRAGNRLHEWSGIVPGRSAGLPGTGDSILLLDVTGVAQLPRGGSNLVRLGGNGIIRWFADVPDEREPDGYVGFEVSLDGRAITAWSWSCFQCSLDPSTGSILRSVFTK